MDLSLHFTSSAEVLSLGIIAGVMMQRAVISKDAQLFDGGEANHQHQEMWV